MGCETGYLWNVLLLQSEHGCSALKAMRDAGVGLLASLITLAANVHFSCPALGFEAPFEASQGGRVSEQASEIRWDAPSTSGFIADKVKELCLRINILFYVVELSR